MRLSTLRYALFVGALPPVLGACSADTPPPMAPGSDELSPGGAASASVDADTFASYWYGGLAELTGYSLTQARYGALREGTATLIYVTEPFSRRRHVKVDDVVGAGEDAAPSLKLNASREFVTGIYPYSMMTSVFTPVGAGARTLKVTTTSQEWCGHTFTQLNRAGNGWRLRAFSYFESEGDRSLALPDVWLEDEVWTTLRLNPRALPLGDLQMLPGTIYQRLSHTEFEPQAVTATIADDSSDSTLRVYSVEYPDLRRTLRIRFRAAFPHEVEGWQETYPDGGEMLTTNAQALGRQRLAYWELNAPGDEAWRDSLGLTPQFRPAREGAPLAER
jgi:hypothetical protein